MIFSSFKYIPKTFLGVDIGTASLKVVELSRWGSRRTLKNYGELSATSMYDKPFRTFEKNAFLLSSDDIARAIRAILQETKIKTKNAVFSIPDFSSFFTNFTIPPVTKEELAQTVEYEARRHIPLPLTSVVFDWQIVDGGIGQKKPMKILLVAVSKELINQYQEIAKKSGVRLAALEAEVFGLIRSSMGEDQRPTIMLDIGAQTTTVNVIFQGTIHISHSVDVAGNSFTERISKSLSIDYKEANAMKAKQGLQSETIQSILAPLVDVLATEVKKIATDFEHMIGQKPQRIILGGGSAVLPGIVEYFKKATGMEAEIIDPFKDIFYPPVLEESIKKMGPSYAVSVGMALRGLE